MQIAGFTINAETSHQKLEYGIKENLIYFIFIFSTPAHIEDISAINLISRIKYVLILNDF